MSVCTLFNNLKKEVFERNGNFFDNVFISKFMFNEDKTVKTVLE